MKILMVAPQPFFEPRGTPISVLQRLQALASLGYEVDLATYHIGHPVSLPGLRIRRSLRLPFLRSIKVGPSLPKAFLDLFLFLRVLTLLLGRRYDALHTHEEAAFFCLPLAALFRIPHLYDMHSSLPRQLENSRFAGWHPLIRLFDWLERMTLRRSGVVLTIDNELTRLARKLHPPARILKIENLPLNIDDPNPVPAAADIAALRRALALEGTRPLVYTGTLESYQGLDYVIEALPDVVAAFPNALLVVVGGQPAQIAALQARAAALNVVDNVLFTGTLLPDEALRYVKAADLLLSPRLEGTSFPLKLYGYLFAGKPILVSDVPTHRTLLAPAVVAYAPPTPAGFAAGINELLTAEELARELAENARSFALQRFDFETYKSAMAAAYKMLLEDVEVPVPLIAEVGEE